MTLAERLILPHGSEYFGERFLPIDPDFQTKRKVVSEHNGHKVWGNPDSNKQPIHGTYSAVDWDVCVGDGVCINVCPVSLYDWAETASGEKRSDPAREADCIQCLACETQCPTQAIKITPPP